MLILSRSKGQKIMINHDIVISIVEVSGDQVRVGIEAPEQVSIYREEIYHAIQQQNMDAALLKGDMVERLLLNMVQPDKK
ncbi:carbon storage regulator CsrA [Paenibacillus phocaensis]|uniref:carbon storage regulator CsrA n=1 Tax=Paenibacillus phocaensis TaxID=1776378 RepID=UPI000839CB8C|nr:carbon storage regulator CsrA [Paenibacillus phocaensis]